ncbi:MAG: hypothetical protein H6625_04400 [Bdellovibrionaceae bacterium]|nr:hypothetical protein [Pseudobdellovibrionaceae bacterium]
MNQEIQMDLDQKTVRKLTVKLEKLKELQLTLDAVNKLAQQNKTKFKHKIAEISKRIAELNKDLRETEIALDRENKTNEIRSAEIKMLEWEILKAKLYMERMRRVMRFAL